ncbi:lysophospholipid acyltransferase family protein [Rhizobiales bacterium]|uniref:lysophospholipid acyltransferase family protein n=1 Tax=Hongsoonwoonella zoysiae TaxID=2821844 RepID=UPI0015619E04|nr:lysophospholipid acyltransferase family protein [Hongsoonwoonella zoysiae]NRG19812.1 lysophospholipid acyltransferase family protein [Hongsoonwoonella zoysiae]
MLKKLGSSPRVQKFVGTAFAHYLRAVRNTSSFEVDPPDFYEKVLPNLPVIVAMWHGQHFMMPFARPEGWNVSVMISRSADGEINAIAARRLGLGLIRASGAQKAHQVKKRGGMRGFIEAMRTLKEGNSVALTADVPKGPARVAGLGIVQLAKHSGRPIVPVAIATSRHIDLNSWDKASVNLPFSRAAVAGGDMIHIGREDDDEALERGRREVEEGLNRATARAYELVKR